MNTQESACLSIVLVCLFALLFWGGKEIEVTKRHSMDTMKEIAISGKCNEVSTLAIGE